MKHGFAILILLLTSALATSCWKVDEDWSLCGGTPLPETRLVLDFHLRNVPDDELTDHIETIDLCLLDQGMNIMQTRRFTRAMLDQSLQTTFTGIEPGTCHVVAWANVGGNMHVTLGGNILDCYLEIESSQTGDPVYYAPHKIPERHPGRPTRAPMYDYSQYEVKIVAGETTTKDMTFGKAHRTVEVFISGWELSGLQHKGSPVVGREGAGGRYDYLLRYDEDGLLALKSSTSLQTINGKEYHVISFHSALLPLDLYSGSVGLVDPHDGTPLPGMTVDMKQYVAENNIEDDSYIPVWFDITGRILPDGDGNVSVNIGLPPWNNHSVHW